MGAAIPQLLILATSLPKALPYPADAIRTEYRTSSVKCMDEVLPGDEEEEEVAPSGLLERKVSGLSVTIVIGDGKKDITGREKKSGKGKKRSGDKDGGSAAAQDADDAMSTDSE